MNLGISKGEDSTICELMRRLTKTRVKMPEAKSCITTVVSGVADSTSTYVHHMNCRFTHQYI